MGYIKHHTIVVTGTSVKKLTGEIDQSIEAAHTKALEIFSGLVTEVVESKMNGYKTFCVVPDGSKEGWPESEEGDNYRNEYIEWLKKTCYDDGSSSLSWAELFYGEDNGYAGVNQHN